MCSQQAGLTFSTGNIFFSLFVLFILFLPLHLTNMSAITMLIRRRPVTLLLLALTFALYMTTFQADHPSKRSEWFLRNFILHEMLASGARKTLAFVPIAWTALSLAVSRFTRPSMYALYFFWVLSLVPIWLIEQRYYIPIVTFYLLFHRSERPRLESIILAYLVAVTGFLSWGILQHRFFL